MSAHSLKYTTHEDVTKLVPLDTIRLIRPMTDEDPNCRHCLPHGADRDRRRS